MSLLHQVWLGAVYFVFKEMHGVDGEVTRQSVCFEVRVVRSTMTALNLRVALSGL